MNADSQLKPTPTASASPMATVGAILAMGVIRLLERQEQLAILTEESVHNGVLTTQENALE